MCRRHLDQLRIREESVQNTENVIPKEIIYIPNTDVKDNLVNRDSIHSDIPKDSVQNDTQSNSGSEVHKPETVKTPTPHTPVLRRSTRKIVAPDKLNLYNETHNLNMFDDMHEVFV